VREFELIGRLLAPIARAPEARGLNDDVAVWSAPAGCEVVLTKDMAAEGVHFLADDPPEAIAAKLLRVNLSDLASKGAVPRGVLLGLGLTPAQDEPWLRRFTEGLAADLARHDVQLWGGDTIRAGERLVLSLTAIGTAPHGAALSRAHARAGDDVYVTGTIGDAWLGLQVLTGALDLPPAHRAAVVQRYRWPEPRVALGPALPGIARASADVSDGLLADARHIAAASGVRVVLEAARLPLSDAAAAWVDADADAGVGAADSLSRRVQLASGGDDYEIVFTASPRDREAVLGLCQRFGIRISRIGRVEAGEGLMLLGPDGTALALTKLGYEHGGSRRGQD